MCKADEISQTYRRQVQGERDFHFIDQGVASINIGKGNKNRFEKRPTDNGKTYTKCKKCQTEHLAGKCLAYGQK